MVAQSSGAGLTCGKSEPPACTWTRLGVGETGWVHPRGDQGGGFPSAMPCTCPLGPHLGQAGEEAGAAGRAAADGGEGIAEDQAAAGQRVQVGGGDGAVVVGATLKASVIG